jgi:predicted transcriptional regulator
VKRITIFLPDELHERLRQEAYRSRTSISQIIRLRLENPVPHQKKHKGKLDPLLRVAGTCRGPIISHCIDEQLYGN